MADVSQNHRMVGVGRDLCGSASPTPLMKQGHLQQAAKYLVQAGLEYLQRRRLHNLPGQPVPVLRHPQREEDPAERGPGQSLSAWRIISNKDYTVRISQAITRAAKHKAEEEAEISLPAKICASRPGWGAGGGGFPGGTRCGWPCPSASAPTHGPTSNAAGWSRRIVGAAMETCTPGVGTPPARAPQHPAGFGEGYGHGRPHGASWERNFVGTHHLLGINLQSLGKRHVPAAPKRLRERVRCLQAARRARNRLSPPDPLPGGQLSGAEMLLSAALPRTQRLASLSSERR